MSLSTVADENQQSVAPTVFAPVYRHNEAVDSVLGPPVSVSPVRQPAADLNWKVTSKAIGVEEDDTISRMAFPA